MTIIVLGLFWGGYTLVWDGYTTIRGTGIGFMDLISPSQIPKVDKWLAESHGNSSAESSGGYPAGTIPALKTAKIPDTKTLKIIGKLKPGNYTVPNIKPDV